MDSIRFCPERQVLALIDVFAYLRGGISTNLARTQLCRLNYSENTTIQLLLKQSERFTFQNVTDKSRRYVMHVIPSRELLLSFFGELCNHFNKGKKNRKLVTDLLNTIDQFCKDFSNIFPGIWGVESDPLSFSFTRKPPSRYARAVDEYIYLNGVAPTTRNTFSLERILAKQKGFEFDNKTALVVIDMQNDFCRPESPLCVNGALGCLPKVAEAVQIARRNKVTVFWVCREHHPSGCDIEISRRKFFENGGQGICVQGTEGAALVPPLVAESGDMYIAKQRWSGFFQTRLDMVLRSKGVKKLVLAGVQTPNCIRATAYDAIALDYPEVFVLSDATASKNDQVQANNLQDMRDAAVQVLTVGEWDHKLQSTLVPLLPRRRPKKHKKHSTVNQGASTSQQGMSQGTAQQQPQPPGGAQNVFQMGYQGDEFKAKVDGETGQKEQDEDEDDDSEDEEDEDDGEGEGEDEPMEGGDVPMSIQIEGGDAMGHFSGEGVTVSIPIDTAMMNSNIGDAHMNDADMSHANHNPIFIMPVNMPVPEPEPEAQ